MGYEVGAIKYFIGMLTSVWGVVTAYLFAQGILEPLTYVQALEVVLRNPEKPERVILGLIEVLLITPEQFAKFVLFGLSVMTISWYVNSKP